MTPTADQLTAALSTVQDPEIRRPITELGMVKSAVVDADGTAAIRLDYKPVVVTRYQPMERTF